MRGTLFSSFALGKTARYVRVELLSDT